jgi:homoserine acetyltransferase
MPLLLLDGRVVGSAINLTRPAGADGRLSAVRALADQAMKADPEWNKGSLYGMMTLDSLPEPMGGAPNDKRDALS